MDQNLTRYSENGAVAGFNEGTLEIFGTLPGSGTNDVINLPQRTNVNISGVWIFQVDSIEIQSKRWCLSCHNYDELIKIC